MADFPSLIAPRRTTPPVSLSEGYPDAYVLLSVVTFTVQGFVEQEMFDISRFHSPLLLALCCRMPYLFTPKAGVQVSVT